MRDPTKNNWQNRAIGRVLYAYGMLWLWPFRLTPAKWIVIGCNYEAPGLRYRWGEFVTSQFGWVRNMRYEMFVMK